MRRTSPTTTRLAPVLVLVLPLACGTDSTGPVHGPCEGPTDDAAGLCLRLVADGLDWPLQTAFAPDGDDRIFLADQRGRIHIIEDLALRDEPFLDITDRVTVAPEQGLVGMTFDPDYAANGYVYVYYTDDSGDMQLDRYTVSDADPDRAEPDSREPILTIPHTEGQHNGGWIGFDPDGYLWITSGDGVVSTTAQDLTDLRGAILRIDVHGGDPYAIPPDNPFVDDPDARDEILYWGLRNPWRVEIDAEAGWVYIADVGGSQREELNIVPLGEYGLNFGWPIVEGSECRTDPDCDTSEFTPPVLDYTHEQGRCAIIGGYVYRGTALPSLSGRYVYGDHCGLLGSLHWEDGEVADPTEYDFGDTGLFNSWGVGPDGELYLLFHDGDVYRLEPVEETTSEG